MGEQGPWTWETEVEKQFFHPCRSTYTRGTVDDARKSCEGVAWEPEYPPRAAPRSHSRLLILS